MNGRLGLAVVGAVLLAVAVLLPTPALPHSLDGTARPDPAMADVTISAQALVSAPTDRINVRADIDGRSRLLIQYNTVQWQHFDWDAPGRENGTDFPTYVNHEPWYPQWPDIPNPENQDCNGCLSSVLNPDPPLPSMENFVDIEEVGYGCRHSCQVVGFPTTSNYFELVIEFDDNPLGGSAWYEIDVLVSPAPSPPPGVGGEVELHGDRANLYANQSERAVPPYAPMAGGIAVAALAAITAGAWYVRRRLS